MSDAFWDASGDKNPSLGYLARNYPSAAYLFAALLEDDGPIPPTDDEEAGVFYGEHLTRVISILGSGWVWDSYRQPRFGWHWRQDGRLFLREAAKRDLFFERSDGRFVRNMDRVYAKAFEVMRAVRACLKEGVASDRLLDERLDAPLAKRLGVSPRIARAYLALAEHCGLLVRTPARGEQWLPASEA